MPYLSLNFLGDYRVALDGQPVSDLPYDKVRALLAYLTVEADHTHRRETLAGLLWPDVPDQAARRNLSQALYKLRQSINDANAEPPFLIVTSQTVQFNPQSDYQLDVADFIRGLASDDVAAQQRAVALYSGAFLHGFLLADSEAFEEWTLLQRESLHRRALDALTRLAEHSLKAGDLTGAQGFAERQLQLDPWREAAHQQMMQALALSGQRSAALAQYETCRKLLADELGVEPGAEIKALYERLRAGELERSPRSTPEPVQISSAPPLAPLHNLPTHLTLFVGREHELADLSELLAQPETRLITLVGPGGMGKTRLAVRAAQQYGTHSSQAVVFVPLQPVQSPDLILSTIVNALGLTLTGQADPKTQLVHVLRDKRMLLVLDNFEHLLDGAGLVVELLQEAPNLKILVTSREALNVSGEWGVGISGLGDDAPTLFRQSARRVRVDFEPGAEDVVAIDRICQLVEGMPLAVELAASWVRVLGCAEIAAEIESNIHFLETNARDVPERHRSLSAVCDYSWKLLLEDERRAMSGLSVFRGGFGREAAEAVAGARLSMLSALVSKSFLRRVEDGRGSGQSARYDLHEFVRRYAYDQLELKGGRAETCDQHLAYYVQVVEGTASFLYGPEQLKWLAYWDREQDNLRAALHWAFEASPLQPERVEQGLKLITPLERFWQGHGHLRETVQRLERGLSRRAGVSLQAQAAALNTWGWFANHLGQHDWAYRLMEESLALYRQVDDAAGLAEALDGLGDVTWVQGDFERSKSFYEESLSIRRSLGDSLRVGLSLYSMARLYIDNHRTAPAAEMLREAFELFEKCRDRRGLALTMKTQGRLEVFEERYADAKLQLQSGLLIFNQLGNLVEATDCIEELAIVVWAEDRLVRAAQLCGAAGSLREITGVPAHREHHAFLHKLRTQLDETVFTAAWAEGRALTQAQVVKMALSSA